MKRRILVVLGLMLAMIMSCGGKVEDKVKKDFEKNMGILQKGDTKALGVSEKDAELFKHLTKGYSKITYKINDVKVVSENEIILNATIKKPDLSGTMEEFMKRSMADTKNLIGKSDKEIEAETQKMLIEIISQKLEDGNIKFTEETMDIVYTKKNGKWDIDTNSNKNTKFIEIVTLGFDK